MKLITGKRCIIGEGPIWNDTEKTLYYTNGGNKEYCKYNFQTEKLECVPLEKDVAAFVFTSDRRLIVSRDDGIFILNKDGSTDNIYDTKRYNIRHANDMKAGPDGRIYVGTQSEKRLGISSQRDGKLFSVDKYGKVTVLLDGLSLSNGMDWSPDGKFFYHTDSDTNIIKEYSFDGYKGTIFATVRQIKVPGVDGFTIGLNDKIYAACWGQGHIAVIDRKLLETEKYISLPCKVPSSCCFAGENTDVLAVTSASFGTDISSDVNAGFTILQEVEAVGRKPYLFG